jgi:pyruvate dehydrogenase E2 component (dihydrolipoamide acetyltransferase)
MRGKEVPMAVAVIMPRQGNTVESCIITKWNKRKGDKVEVGDILFSYETDKAAFDEEAKVAGTLIDVFFEEGDDVPCLTNVCVIGAVGESADEFRPGGAVPAPAMEEKAETSAAVAEPTSAELAEPVVISGDMKISPRAKALAEARGADLSFVQPTGPDGRVIARDVQALVDAGCSYRRRRPLPTRAAFRAQASAGASRSRTSRKSRKRQLRLLRQLRRSRLPRSRLESPWTTATPSP